MGALRVDRRNQVVSHCVELAKWQVGATPLELAKAARKSQY